MEEWAAPSRWGTPDGVVGESGGQHGGGGKPWPCRERGLGRCGRAERRWDVVEGLEILGRGVSVLTSVENNFICFWKST